MKSYHGKEIDSYIADLDKNSCIEKDIRKIACWWDWMESNLQKVSWKVMKMIKLDTC